MNSRSIIAALLLSLSLPWAAFGQVGGDNTYEFLNLPWSARGSALGGVIVSISGEEPSFITGNPALATENMHGLVSLGYASYVADIGFGTASYIFRGIGGTIATGLNWLNYGSFIGADNSGNITGSFKAAEYAMNLIYSRTIDTIFNIGVNLKPVLSQLESYTSFGVALDIGASVTSRNSLLSAGVVLRNIGFQAVTYAGEGRERLPFEIQAGVSGKLEHAPLRLSLTLRNLQKYDLTHSYDTTSYAGSPGSASARDGFAENMLRHMLFGVEFLPHQSFWVGAGYNYQRRSELRIDSGGAAAGFSWGFGVNISGFRLAFSRATYHLAGISNQFSLAFNPASIYRRITE